MPKPIVPSAEDVAKKWSEETPRRATYYEKNTPPAADRWATETTAATENYKGAVAAADIGRKFAGGVKKAGAAKFKRKVESVGIGRFGPGVTAALDDMKSGVDPYLPVIAATEIGARKPRGDPGNYDRVKKIGDALHSKRLAVLAAGPA
jgi:hypothetical protein